MALRRTLKSRAIYWKSLRALYRWNSRAGMLPEKLGATAVHKIIEGRNASPSSQIVVEIARSQVWGAHATNALLGTDGFAAGGRRMRRCPTRIWWLIREVSVGRIFRNLDGHEADIRTEMRKQSTDGVAAAVANYDKIESLVGTECATLQPPVSDRYSAW